jgi:hypothetical protein
LRLNIHFIDDPLMISQFLDFSVSEGLECFLRVARWYQSSVFKIWRMFDGIVAVLRILQMHWI